MKPRYVCVSISIIMLVLFSNCAKEREELDLETYGPFEEMSGSELPNICTELHVENPARAFGDQRVFWNRSTLRVRFLGGSSYVQSKVKQYAHEWSQHANIRFQFVDSEPSDIRISFEGNSGSWSYVGRNNQYISATRATMNFGWFNNRTRDSEFRRTTLHEFGHALGLSHEHQHPNVSINWNRPAVYQYYQRTQDWSTSEVDGNIFRKYSLASSNYSQYDPASIMHYYIPRSLVIGTWNPTWNTRLSSTDIDFIKQVYPAEVDPGIESCTCPETLSIIACEDFEALTQAGFEQADHWKRWSSSAGHAELQSYSWGHVIKMAYAPVANPDILYLPVLMVDGTYELQWKMYVGSNNSGYFNIQKFKQAGREFGAQFYFDRDATGRVEVNNRSIRFNYEQGVWTKMTLSIDLVNDLITFSIDGRVVTSWPASWSAQSNTGTKQFAGINFYAIDIDSRFWLDDFCLGAEESRMSDTKSGRSLLNANVIDLVVRDN